MTDETRTPSPTLSGAIAEWLRREKPHLYAHTPEDESDAVEDSMHLASHIEQRMGQAPDSITLSLHPSDDPDLTCAVCRLLGVDLEATIGITNGHADLGIHRRCVERAGWPFRLQQRTEQAQEQASGRPPSQRSAGAAPRPLADGSPEESAPFGERASDALPNPFGPKCPKGDECEHAVFLQEYERVDRIYSEHVRNRALEEAAKECERLEGQAREIHDFATPVAASWLGNAADCIRALRTASAKDKP